MLENQTVRRRGGSKLILDALPMLLVAASLVIYVVFFSWISIVLHNRFWTAGYDLGNFDQAIWNTLHGRVLGLTNLEGFDSRLGLHFEPILILLSPLYLIWSDPRALLLVQTAALAAGAIPIYRLAKERLGRWPALGFVIIYLLFPALEGANVFQFHASTLAVPFLAAAFHAIEQRWYRAMGVWAALAMACREEIALVVGMLGLYMVLTQRETRGWWLVGAGAAVFCLAAFVVIPGASRTGEPPHASWFAPFGDSTGHTLRTLGTEPGVVARYVLSNPDKVRYLTHLLAPVALASLLYAPALLPVLPVVGINLLSSWPAMYVLNRFHYSVTTVPFILFAAVLGTERLAKGLQRRRRIATSFIVTVLMAAMLVTSLGYHRQFGHTPLSEGFSVPEKEARYASAYEMFELIPKDAAVSAQASLNPHLTQRETIYLFPKIDDPNGPAAAYVALDRRGNVYPATVEEYDAAVRELLDSEVYEVVFERDGYVLLRRVDP